MSFGSSWTSSLGAMHLQSCTILHLCAHIEPKPSYSKGRAQCLTKFNRFKLHIARGKPFCARHTSAWKFPQRPKSHRRRPQIAGVKVYRTCHGQLSPQRAISNESTNMRNICQLNAPPLPTTDVKLQDLPGRHYDYCCATRCGTQYDSMFSLAWHDVVPGMTPCHPRMERMHTTRLYIYFDVPCCVLQRTPILAARHTSGVGACSPFLGFNHSGCCALWPLGLSRPTLSSGSSLRPSFLKKR